MSKNRYAVISFVLFITGAAVGTARQHRQMRPGMTHEEHLTQIEKDASLKRRGAAAMGFDQDKTTHHFRLTADGGEVEVTVADASDAAGLVQVRTHLKAIAAEFAGG